LSQPYLGSSCEFGRERECRDPDLSDVGMLELPPVGSSHLLQSLVGTIEERKEFDFARSGSGWFKFLTVKGLEESVFYLEMTELQERQFLQNPCLYCNAFNGIFVKGNIRGKWYTTRKTKSYGPLSRSRESKHQPHNKCVLYNIPLPHPPNLP
jgi:hypothetical protein